MFEGDRRNYPEIHICNRKGSHTEYGIYSILSKFGESTEKMCGEESGFDYERCKLIGQIPVISAAIYSHQTIYIFR